jgi:hypothetical protein
VTASDRQGLLRDIGEALARERINVTAVRTQSRSELAYMRFSFEVSDLPHLRRALAAVKASPASSRRLASGDGSACRSCSTIPAVQSSVAPFLAGLLVAGLLFPLRLGGLAAAAGFLATVYLVGDFTLDRSIPSASSCWWRWQRRCWACSRTSRSSRRARPDRCSARCLRRRRMGVPQPAEAENRRRSRAARRGTGGVHDLDGGVHGLLRADALRAGAAGSGSAWARASAGAGARRCSDSTAWAWARAAARSAAQHDPGPRVRPKPRSR